MKNRYPCKGNKGGRQEKYPGKSQDKSGKN